MLKTTCYEASSDNTDNRHVNISLNPTSVDWLGPNTGPFVYK